MRADRAVSASWNRGPAGFAKIKDGKYDTAVGGKGVVGGPHVVRISGSGEIAAGGAAGGATLFADHVVKIDLPKEKTTQDFDIPESARLPATSGPGPDYRGP